MQQGRLGLGFTPSFRKCELKTVNVYDGMAWYGAYCMVLAMACARLKGDSKRESIHACWQVG